MTDWADELDGEHGQPQDVDLGQLYDLDWSRIAFIGLTADVGDLPRPPEGEGLHALAFGVIAHSTREVFFELNAVHSEHTSGPGLYHAPYFGEEVELKKKEVMNNFKYTSGPGFLHHEPYKDAKAKFISKHEGVSEPRLIVMPGLEKYPQHPMFNEANAGDAAVFPSLQLSPLRQVLAQGLLRATARSLSRALAGCVRDACEDVLPSRGLLATIVSGGRSRRPTSAGTASSGSGSWPWASPTSA